MLVPPKRYGIVKNDKLELGGYLLNDIKYIEPLIIDKHNLVHKSEILKKNIIFDMVNNLSTVAFTINEKVLEFILKNYKKYDLIIDPEFIHPLSTKDKLNLREKKELESFYSRKRLEENILSLANYYLNVSQFYIPVRIDYRGRLYCNSDYLNYQGIELAKSLLKFSTGEKVYLSDEVSIKYLKIFGANC